MAIKKTIEIDVDSKSLGQLEKELEQKNAEVESESKSS